METKSRYEVLAQLEENKRKLIVDRDSLQDEVKKKERVIKIKKRELEDLEEDLHIFIESLEPRKQTIQALIDSVDDGIKRFQTQSTTN